ncbi:MAG: NAD(P)H-dependent oxidoreductase [Paracoccaceae bacterium]|nr:NAD(P)H-dependent oxidoreductase [Paracoccaceae bacterium]
MTTTILKIDSSARHTGSVSRDLTQSIADRFAAAGDIRLIERDLADGVPFISEAWIDANFTKADQRSDGQKALLSTSDALVAEIQAADVLVIGVPIYNFSVPAAFKAWVDQVARAGLTFQYTEYGPKGLLEGKRAIVAVASGGTEVGSEIDFATGYISHVLGFIGITDVVFVKADRLMVDAEASLKSAEAEVATLDLAA